MTRFAHVTDRQLRAWVVRGYPLPRIAELMGCSTESVARRVRSLWQEAQSRSSRYDDPSEEEISQACAEIQAGWSEEERMRRAGYFRASVEATVVPESNLQRLAPGRR